MRAKISLTLYYLVAGLVLLGGLGDLTITSLLDAQREFLSGGGQHPISPAAERSFLAVLHAMGGGLVGVGASSLCLVHFGIRRGQRWAIVAAVMAIGCAEGANTLGLASLGSPLALVTASYLLLLTIATALALAPSFAFADRR